MVNKLLQLLAIRCAHRKLSQPFAASASVPRRREVNADWDSPIPPTAHYVVCLDCGHKFDYDWGSMRVIQK
jgi:hypothetical protein